ncbi:MAG: M81 family metallopeptidase [Pseudomonadota bacterium]
MTENASSSGPRVALCGIALESNTLSPVTHAEDFHGHCYLTGKTLLESARAPVSNASMEMRGFVRTMDVTGPWEPVPLTLTGSHPWGPVEHVFFRSVVDEIVTTLKAAGSVDAVYVANHGAMVSTETFDPDGELYEALRNVVGPGVPIVGTLDLHGNVSERMIEMTDLLVTYLTNPHVDMYERGEETALALRGILGGTVNPQTAFIRMPMTPASVTLLSAAGPYADLIDYGQRRKRELAGQILNVSILGGFVFGDTPKNGIAILVTGRDALEPAQRVAREIAERAWADRERFRRELTPVETAVEMAHANAAEPGRPAQIFSDSGDNPGGGGGGNTVELLRALVEADAKQVLFGTFFDAPLAAEAAALGTGARFEAVFNRDTDMNFAPRYAVEVEVIAVNTESFAGRLGIYAEREIHAAPTAALQIGGPGGITVVVQSKRYQTADPMFFEHLGLDIAAARTVCVKSRGHFRAGFIPWFQPEQVFEVDTLGLTSPVLDRVDFQHLPRPVFPLDDDVDWVPPNWGA